MEEQGVVLVVAADLVVGEVPAVELEQVVAMD